GMGGHRSRLQLFDEGGHDGDLRWLGVVVGWAGHGTRGGPRPTVVGGPRGSWCRSGSAAGGREGHQKSRGPDLAHGSWFVFGGYRLRLARDGHRSPADREAIGRL